jgi:Kef-type K+ transport system membrane component KefB
MEPALAVGISVTVIMLSALLFDRLKLPSILGVLAAGILMGPFSPLAGANFFGIEMNRLIIFDPSTVSVFALIGAALILFGIGLEFSVIKLAQLGLFTFLAAVVKIGAVYLAGYAALSGIGLSPQSAALVAVALSFSSTPIIVKLLEASGKIKRQEAPFIISILIIEDLLAVFFLGLISNPVTATEYSFAISLLRVVLTFIFAYLILSKFVNIFLTFVSHSDELLILSTVSLVLILGYVSEAIGLSFSVGAFLAGSTIAGSAQSRKIEEKIRPFNSLFASFFFFSIGLFVNVGSVLTSLWLLAIFIIIGIFVRFASAGVSSYLAGLQGRSACFCAAAFLPMSELSLLLLSQGMSQGLVQPEFLGSFAFAIIASSFLSAWLISRENEIYNLLLSVAPEMAVKNFRLLRSTAFGMRRAVSEGTHYYKVVEKLPSISYSYKPEQLSSHDSLILTSKNSALLALLSTACYTLLFFAQQPGWGFLDSFFVFSFLAFFVLSALFLVNLRAATKSVMKMMLRSGRGAKYAAAGYFLQAALFLCLAAAYVWAYSLAPSSLSVILVLPCLFFAARSLAQTFKSVSSGIRL